MLIAERIKTAAPHCLAARQQGEQIFDQAHCCLFWPTARISLPCQKRHHHMIDGAIARRKLAVQRRAKICPCVKACHLIFILVGHHTVQLARHDAPQGLIITARCKRIKTGAVEIGIGSILVIGQQARAVIDDLRVILRDWCGAGGWQQCFRHTVWCRDHQPPDIKGQPVHLRLDAVQFNGPENSFDRHRDRAVLPGSAQHHDIRIHNIPKRRLGHIGGVEPADPVVASCQRNGGQPVIYLQVQIALADNLAGGHFCQIDYRAGALAIGGHRGWRCGYHCITANQRVSGTAGNPCLVQLVRSSGKTNKAHHRAKFLRQPGKVQKAGRGPVKMGSHRQHCAHCNHPGSPDTCNDDVIGIADCWRRRVGKGGNGGAEIRHAGCLCQTVTLNRHKAGAESVKAGEILVAAGQVDTPLAAKRCFQRLHAQTVRCHRTIAAAFAYSFIDHHMACGVCHSPALAAAALFSSACLLVDQDRDAFEFTQFALQTVHLGAVVKTGQCRKTAALNGGNIIRYEGNAANALGSADMGDSGW